VLEKAGMKFERMTRLGENDEVQLHAREMD
jgi:hypothetical protein